MSEKEQANEVFIRQLGREDWQKYKTIRLEALQNDPQAFGGSYEKESQRTDQEWQEHMGRVMGNTASGVLVGAESAQKQLIGTIGSFEKAPGVWRLSAVYVKPSFRSKGISKRLLDQVISLVSSKPEVLALELTVNINQEAAVRLYKSRGFEVVGIEQGHIMGDGKAYDSYMMRRVLN